VFTGGRGSLVPPYIVGLALLSFAFATAGLATFVVFCRGGGTDDTFQNLAANRASEEELKAELRGALLTDADVPQVFGRRS
jgi:hypothetical protein